MEMSVAERLDFKKLFIPIFIPWFLPFSFFVLLQSIHLLNSSIKGKGKKDFFKEESLYFSNFGNFSLASYKYWLAHISNMLNVKLHTKVLLCGIKTQDNINVLLSEGHSKVSVFNYS